MHGSFDSESLIIIKNWLKVFYEGSFNPIDKGCKINKNKEVLKV